MKEIDVILDDHTILVNIGTVQSSELYMQINTGRHVFVIENSNNDPCNPKKEEKNNNDCDNPGTK